MKTSVYLFISLILVVVFVNPVKADIVILSGSDFLDGVHTNTEYSLGSGLVLDSVAGASYLINEHFSGVNGTAYTNSNAYISRAYINTSRYVAPTGSLDLWLNNSVTDKYVFFSDNVTTDSEYTFSVWSYPTLYFNIIFGQKYWSAPGSTPTNAATIGFLSFYGCDLHWLDHNVSVHDSGYVMPNNQWVAFRVVFDFDNHTFEVQINSVARLTDIPFWHDVPLNSIKFETTNSGQKKLGLDELIFAKNYNVGHWDSEVFNHNLLKTDFYMCINYSVDNERYIDSISFYDSDSVLLSRLGTDIVVGNGTLITSSMALTQGSWDWLNTSTDYYIEIVLRSTCWSSPVISYIELSGYSVYVPVGGGTHNDDIVSQAVDLFNSVPLILIFSLLFLVIVVLTRKGGRRR